MRLSFVIPAHNEERYIGDCLESIIKQRAGAPCDVEIIVVNNASTDRTKEIASSYPGVKVVDEPEKGIVRARQAGFLASSGDLIANVDSDTRLTPQWIAKVAAAFSANKDLVAISGPFTYYDLPKKVRFWVGFFYYVAFYFYLVNRFIFRIGSMLQGGNFVVRRSGLEAIGGYNTDIDFYGEDADLARRLNKVGRVRFTFDLPIYSSGRRLAKEGALTMGLRYGLNYFWMIFFKRPFSKTSTDVRLAGKSAAVYRPENKLKEWMIALSAILVFAAAAGGAAYAGYRLVESGVIGTITWIKVVATAKEEAMRVKENISAISSTTKSMLKNRLNAGGQ